MGIVSMFRVPQPQQFKYTPIFYDPIRESVQNREQQIKQELGLSDEGAKRISGIKGQFQRHLRKTKRPKATYNLRLIIIIGILMLLVYFLLYH